LQTRRALGVVATNHGRSRKVLHELYRLEGFFDAATAAGDLYQVLTQNNYWPADRPAPEPLPTSDLAYPNMACTPAGARKLGIVPQ